jgi:GT2 family glycosyltransferase
VSKKIIDDIGFFDSVSFKGAAGEDPDWGRRVFEAGYPQVYAENAVIKHPAVSTLRALWRKTKRITRGNVALSNKYKNKCAKGAAGYLGFLYKAIWADDRDKGILQKICLTFIALTVVMVKLRVRLTI